MPGIEASSTFPQSWLDALSRLSQGRVGDPSQDKLYAAQTQPWQWGREESGARAGEMQGGLLGMRPQWVPAQSGATEAVPFGSIADPVSQLAFYVAPGIAQWLTRIIRVPTPATPGFAYQASPGMSIADINALKAKFGVEPGGPNAPYQSFASVEAYPTNVKMTTSTMPESQGIYSAPGILQNIQPTPTTQLQTQKLLESQTHAHPSKLLIHSNWQDSSKIKLKKGESQFFHSTYAYNIDPLMLKNIEKNDSFILDRRLFVDTVPQLGYGRNENVSSRPFSQNPDELILFRIITKDSEPFKKIQQEGLDLKDISMGGFTGGPEPRFDPKYLGYNLKLHKIGEETLEEYDFPHRVFTYEVEKRLPINNNKE